MEYARMMVFSALAFAAIFTTYYCIYLTLEAGGGEFVHSDDFFTALRYSVFVETRRDCTLYLPIPSSDTFSFRPDAVEVPEGWRWSLVDVGGTEMLRLNVNGSGTFVADFFCNVDLSSADPSLSETSKVYLGCPAAVRVEVTGEKHWKEYRRLLIWTKECVRCGCYRNWIVAKGEGWVEVESGVLKANCRVTKCKYAFYCPNVIERSNTLK